MRAVCARSIGGMYDAALPRGSPWGWVHSLLTHEHKRAGPPFLLTGLEGFHVAEACFSKTVNPFLNGMHRHVDVEGRRPVVTGFVFDVVIETDDQPTFLSEPCCLECFEKRHGVFQIVKKFHRMHQINGFIWRPFGKRGQRVRPFRIDGSGFFDHGVGAVNSRSARATRFCVESSDHPTVSTPNIDGGEPGLHSRENGFQHGVDAAAVALFHPFIPTRGGPVAKQIRCVPLAHGFG